MFVDSHCHLDKLDYQDLHADVSDVLAKAHQAKVEYLLSVGVTLDSFPKMLAMIEPFSQVYASCGVHPLDVQSDFSLDLFHQYA
ncbi:TatD family hydrolase, partial [Vibrio cholerae]